jgi:hypothetical protein
MGDTGKGGGGGGGSSLASIGLDAYATMLKAQGQQTADEYQANRLDAAAKVGDAKASQTGASMSRNLVQTLGNIDAVRAAAHADPNSPTGAAFRDNEEQIGIQQMVTATGNIRTQAAQSRADAEYYRDKASDDMLLGGISAASGIVKGLSKLSIPGGG